MFSPIEIEVSDASRPIKAKKFKEAGVEYLQREVAYDGLVVLVNK